MCTRASPCNLVRQIYMPGREGSPHHVQTIRDYSSLAMTSDTKIPTESL